LTALHSYLRISCDPLCFDQVQYSTVLLCSSMYNYKIYDAEAGYS